mgnify:CR=1 FL=1
MKPLKNKVSITLDEDLVERIKQLAENDDRSFSQYINLVLKDYVNKVDATHIISLFVTAFLFFSNSISFKNHFTKCKITPIFPR